MYFQFRVDDHDTNKASGLLKRYADKHHGKFLLSKEVGSQSGKPHLQGFCFCTAEPPAYKQFFSRAYPEHGTHGKCFTPVKKIGTYLAYLLDNDSKTKPEYSDLITNYTESEYQELTKDIVQFVSKDKLKKSPQSWWDSTVDILDQKCVYKGRILYSTIPTVFFSLPMPKRLSKLIIKENLQGMIMELERRHQSNTRLHDEYMENIAADPLFRHSKEEFNLFKKIDD